MAEKKKPPRVAKRRLFQELTSGVQALRAHRDGQVTLRTHHVEPIAVPPINSDFVRETREALHMSRQVLRSGSA
jgi:putative transcriptional regulator